MKGEETIATPSNALFNLVHDVEMSHEHGSTVPRQK